MSVPICSVITTDACRTAVQCLITLRIDYCSTLLGEISTNLIRRLQRVQNKAAYLVLRALPPDHVTSLLRELHGWLLCHF
ncbi:hypothetical protein HOLleu_37167 [Holothuria leucospilota]|uniref:Uncharacterized protein n=1 Tax=Holothuria leucospilota TaxID=206669 RepID=A0A9Q1BEK1_HOLLE|nr:hypothetical protein HOLleu_37167 [Holothuria leucospilota]